MKVKIALVVFALGLAFVSGGLAASPEEKLAMLQIEEAALMARYAPNNPKLANVQADIKTLKATPKIENEKYFNFLRSQLTRLQIDRKLLSQRYRNTSPKFSGIDAQIAFIQEKLNQKSP